MSCRVPACGRPCVFGRVTCGSITCDTVYRLIQGGGTVCVDGRTCALCNSQATPGFPCCGRRHGAIFNAIQGYPNVQISNTAIVQMQVPTQALMFTNVWSAPPVPQPASTSSRGSSRSSRGFIPGSSGGPVQGMCNIRGCTSQSLPGMNFCLSCANANGMQIPDVVRMGVPRFHAPQGFGFF